MDCTRISLVIFFCILALGPQTNIALKPALILTPLVKQNKTVEARKLSLVDPKLFLNTTSYSGFLTVEEKYNSNLFFWYFPVVGKPKDNPWIIWLQGGPGGSSLSGVFLEMGPFSYNRVEQRLESREHSWCKDYSMVFIDNPVGAGFSFTNSNDGFPKTILTVTNHLLTALKQLVAIFPELKDGPLYLAGESYAGYYVPTLALDIITNSFGNDSVNLKGLILGNPVLNREAIANYSAIFYQWGLIDNQGLLATKPLQDRYIKSIKSNNNSEAYKLRGELLGKLDDISAQPQEYNVLKDDLKLADYQTFLQLPAIKDALHVGSIKFTFSNSTTGMNLAPEFLTDMSANMEILLQQYKVLIYCGQLDMMSACVPNAESRRHWKWDGRDAFLADPRTPWWFNNTIAGYIKSGGNLTEALIRNSGHLVPYEKPAESRQLISYFIRGLDFPYPPNYVVSQSDTPILPEYEETPSTTQASTVIAANVTERLPPVPKIIVTTSKGSIATIVISIIANIALGCALVIVFNKYRRNKAGIRHNLWSYDNLHESLESGL